MALSRQQQAASVWALYALGLVPAVYMFWLGASGQLGADPVKTFERFLSLWALRFLLAGLFVSPLREIAGINLLRYRRALGLLAFYYVAFHFTAYFVLDQALSLSAVVADVVKRPFITFGMLGLTILIPLALTSNGWSIRRLGPRWNKLHKIVYAAVALGTLHYAMSVKVLVGEQFFYIALAILLLAYRMFRRPILDWKKSRKLAARAH